MVARLMKASYLLSYIDDARGFLNTKVKIAFTLNDADDAKFFSEALGKRW
jgi:hypothetical protein